MHWYFYNKLTNHSYVSLQKMTSKESGILLEHSSLKKNPNWKNPEKVERELMICTYASGHGLKSSSVC